MTARKTLSLRGAAERKDSAPRLRAGMGQLSS